MNEWYKHTINKDDPNADKQGRVFEHRKVAAEKLGRLLLPGEVVHHIDENKLNNDPEILMVFASQSDHSRFHMGGEAVLDGDHYITIQTPEMLINATIKGFGVDKEEAIKAAKTHAPHLIHKCPCCGKDTLTIYCSYECSHKGTMKYNWSKEELEKDLIEYKDITSIARKYNVSDNAIRTHLNQFGLPSTHEEIVQYKINAGVLEPKKPKQDPTPPKCVAQIDPKTDEIIQIFDSQEKAAAALGKPHCGCNIGRVCNGQRTLAYGYKWETIEG